MTVDVVGAMDMTELMTDAELGARVFTVRRAKASGFTAEGLYEPKFDERQLTGIVQPATMRDLQILPEGTSLDAVISVWSSEELRVGDGDERQPDVLVIDRETFRVTKCEPWEQAGYWRAYAERYVGEDVGS